MIAPGLSAPLQGLSAAISGLVTQVSPAIVSISSDRAASSGFLWRPGLVVTAAEALAEEGDIDVTFADAAPVAGKVVGRDPTTDVALLRVERPDALPVALEPATAAAGSVAIVIGAEAGAPTVAFGVVSRATGPWRSLRGGAIDARIELDVSLRRRSEGGLALDASGRAYGMAVFGPRRRVLVIPAATVERVAAALATQGRIPRGYLGLGLQRVPIPGANAAGAIVISVDPRGPATKAGILQGDVLVAWNGDPIGQLHSLLRALGPDSVGKTVSIGLRRAGERRDVSLTIAESPEA